MPGDSQPQPKKKTKRPPKLPKPTVEDVGEMNVPPLGKKIPLNQKRADLFAKEYVKDFNSPHALMRLGWCRNLIDAKDEARRFLDYPRVHHALSALIYGQDGVIAEKTLIMNKLWEEANTAREGSTRLGALSKLASYLGMDPSAQKLNGDTQKEPAPVEAISDATLKEFAQRFKKAYA